MVEFIELSAEAKNESSSPSSMSDNDAVLPYLRRILAAARNVASVPATSSKQGGDNGKDGDSRMDIVVETMDERETAGAYFVDQIARQLLAACQTNVLAASTSNLPSIVSVQGEHDVIEEDENDEDFPVLIYQRRRIDYVRGLLRAMAPIAVDVAAHVVSIVQATATTEASKGANPRIPDQTAVAAWILFSQWLPVASHITPLVSGLFALSAFSCPLLLLPYTKLEQTKESQRDRWLIIEAAHNLFRFYDMRREHEVVMQWWNWSPIFRWLSNNDGDVEMKDNDNDDVDDGEFPFDLETVVRWHAARVAAYVLHLVSAAVSVYLDRFGVRNRIVPWVMHPWAIDQEEFVVQDLYFRGRAQIWKDDDTFFLPAAEQIRAVVPLHPYLVHVGSGLIFCKHGAVRTGDAAVSRSTAGSNGRTAASSSRQLVRTATTAQNISLLGTAMAMDPNPPPILICGPHGSGKSSLVRELAHLLSATSHVASHHDDQLLEIHVDEETDTKTLVGSYTTTDIPGQFEWRPGALTWAVRTGKWVLMEDIDCVPVEIQASLVQLLKERILSLGNGKFEHCHPEFRLFGTMTTSSDSSLRRRTFRGTSGKRLLHPSLWTKVDVEPLPFTELKEIASGLYPSIPDSIVDAALAVFRASDESGRAYEGGEDGVEPHGSTGSSNLLIGRPPSVRDLFKVLSRIAHGIVFERNVAFATESQRTLSLAETVDIFVAPCPDRDVRREFIRSIAAPMFGISSDLALRYVETRRPTVLLHETCTEVGRGKIEVSASAAIARTQSQSFAETDYALRLMESIGVCIRENEPTLLVGETGCGKTTLLQHLAELSGRELIVQNLSLQTDSTDLLGGYRPLEIQHVARRVYEEFLDLFVSTFSRKQNADFLGYASTVLKKRQWKKLSQTFRRAAKLGMAKVRDQANEGTSDSLVVWQNFTQTAERFEQQRLACDTGLAFVFTEGALVDAVRKGKWVLLDEINLASSETLQRLCGLLDDRTGSLTLTERGDAVAIERHSDFRLFAAMNPATDAGKKDLNPTIRSRFTEMYVDELLDPVELRVVAGRYIGSVLPAGDRPPEHTDIVISVVNLYLHCRDLAERVLVDGGGQKPRFTLRTLTRALTAARSLVLEQKLPLKRALYEGFELAFQGPLDSSSLKIVQKALYASLGDGLKKGEMDHPGRQPGGRGGSGTFVVIKPFWIKLGPIDPVDWSEPSENGRSKFILTPSTVSNLRRLARAVASGPWPILLEGPTSSGKTTLVEYIAARCGHHVVRINNHEHTDIQEYTGGFAADSNGSLSFQDGLLVRALRLGHWVILDELNLAPSEVLEALNRLLDDNRELYIAEINETVKPHPNFRLFATQNPSGAYGGRKPLSRAFRNRFVEIHFGDIPSDEMTTILEKRSACPPSHARILVSIMNSLRQRRSKSGVFLGKDGFITPRDLLRWAERGASSKVELAREGYMLLAERLRTNEEKEYVREELEKQIKVKIDLDSFYYGDMSAARILLEKALSEEANSTHQVFSSIAPTKSLLRLVTLVLRCIEQREPVLLVGDTGCGKTTVVQLLSAVFRTKLHIVNCHATTETSDLLGGLRPVRGRTRMARQMFQKIRDLIAVWPNKEYLASVDIPDFIVSELGEPSALLGNEERGNEASSSIDLPEDAVSRMILFTRLLWGSRAPLVNPRPPSSEVRISKRRKLVADTSVGIDVDVVDVEVDVDAEQYTIFAAAVDEIEDLFRRHNALFEWANGPLVHAMKSGEMILLDEMSLAEDAVLERLNSVLEPSRTLVLAEKGANEDDDGESRLITAHQSFQLFATMNPGGDFGKRELSPALRSRFTEIWVPPVTDPFDIDLVLECALTCADLDVTRKDVKERMMEYVAWFNGPVCCDPTRPCSELALSLRDVLTWARFIVAAVQVNKELDVWGAYLHGASLMHLDGLGLGTGLAVEDAASTKTRADAFLVERMPSREHQHNERLGPTQFRVVSGKFGTDPFWIPTGPLLGPEVMFNLEAPTTSINVLRVLRAMQLSKPVLLEGSPGVGKTSLIGALAAASGHRLIRINLSEQTDIADLIGSDLPVPEKDSQGISRAAFRWCDGVLLSAIKAGDWVLLDELNLAPQSVLEGLNSCLDHRANVYIPELGRTFACPPTFRVFAAQNPLGQGGGRKGLPKSFLNRFTKVYVDALTSNDLRSIVGTRFPSIAKPLVDKLVDFNSQIHQDVVETCAFGQAGSPWEFNLRDIFRWCELFAPTQNSSESLVSPQFARDLYFQRFRTSSDREALRVRYSATFGGDINSAAAPELTVTDTIVQIGDVTLPRKRTEGFGRQDVSGMEPTVSLSLLEPMVAVARCVEMNWPCLLVGPSGSGKESLVSGLAELCNTRLIRVALSPSSDVSELIGCFEQVGSLDEYHSLLQSLKSIATDCLHSGSSRKSERIGELALALNDTVDAVDTNVKDRVENAFELASLLSSATTELPGLGAAHAGEIASALAVLRSMRSSSEGNQDRAGGHFEWKDGVLVQAMIHGHWLILQNANLCSSSVLDRLNPVMEPDGSLLLAECGSTDDDGVDATHRHVRCHPDFRIFLSVDPDHGEVSRAMRNRCVEISLLGVFHREGPRSFVDGLDTFWRAGLRSSLLASTLLRVHGSVYARDEANHAEQLKPGDVQSVGCVLSSLQLRGVQSKLSLSACFRIMFSVDPEKSYHLSNEISKVLVIQKSVALAPRPSIRSDLAPFAEYSRIDWEARLLRLFAGLGQSLPSSEVLLPVEFQGFEKKVAKPDLNEKYERLCPLLPDDPRGLVRIRDHVLSLFLGKGNSDGYLERVDFLQTLDDSGAKSLRFMAKNMRKVLQNGISQSSGKDSASGIVDFRSSEGIQLIGFRRLPQLLQERVWLERTQRFGEGSVLTQGLSVLAVSFFVSDGRIDRSSIVCPLTPTLYPFFRSFDQWAETFTALLSQIQAEISSNLSELFGTLLSRRDELRDLLLSSQFAVAETEFLGFEETEFIVQWTWFRKALKGMEPFQSLPSSKLLDENKRRLNVLVEAIDHVIYDSASGGMYFGASVLKRSTRPLVPRKIEHWKVLLALRDIVESSSLDLHSLQESGTGTELMLPVELHDLVRLRHPILFVEKKVKREILAALCTVHFTSTDEVPGKVPEILPLGKLQDVFKSQLARAKREFSTDLDSIKIDTQTETVENSMSVDELEVTMSAGRLVEITYSRMTEMLLGGFGNLQLSPSVEFWCEYEEARLIREIYRILVEQRTIHSDRPVFIALRDSLQKFVHIAISRTSWKVTDLRPYQSILWMIEGALAGDPIHERFLRCLLPQMSYNASRRTWSGAIYRFWSISRRLELPALLDADNDTDADVDSKSYQNAKVPEPIWSAMQHTPSSTVFSLVAGRFVNDHEAQCLTSVTTIENFRARGIQSRSLVDVLSTLEPDNHCEGPFEISYLLIDILEALAGSFPDSAVVEEVISNATRSDHLLSADEPRLRTLLETCTNQVFLEFLEPVVLPLFSCLHRLWRNSANSFADSSRDYALSRVYLGLLRFHLLIPDSPLDPGRKPIAKVALIERRLSDLRLQVSASRIDCGISTGDFSPDTETIHSLLDEGQRLWDKKQRQGKKVIERPGTGPSFVYLFRELKDFARSFVGLSSVLSLTNVLDDTASSEPVEQRESNWQMTTEAFCDRLMSMFAVYEDVTLPLVGAIASMKVGLRALLVQRTSPTGAEPKEASVMKTCLNFPFAESFTGSDAVGATLNSIDVSSRDGLTYQRDLAFALLSRLVLERLVIGANRDIIHSCLATLDRLLDGSEVLDDSEIPFESTAEMEEKEFRAQFPDHRKDFQGLLQRRDDDDSVESVPVESPDEADDNVLSHGTHQLNDEQRDLLCSLHRDLFVSMGRSVRDDDRLRAFRMSYGAGYRAYGSFNCNSPLSMRGASSAHVMALSLATPSEKTPVVGVSSKLPLPESQPDFHKDPNPVEVMKAADPLGHLMARIAQLLTAFPGNDVLIAVGRVADRVRKFDINSVSVGKAMVGLEVILKHAQDWEQHASDRVKLGQPLLDISRTVACWRKLELQNWPTLLRTREETYSQRGMKHWGSLHRLLRRALVAPSEENASTSSDLRHLSPRWVWKGIKVQAERLRSPLSETSEELSEFVKVLDTFVLTSPLGQFKARLGVIDAFASQLQEECFLSGSNTGRLHLARALGSLHRYYDQFSEFLASRLDELRRPFEKRLQEETKLGKWDQQSYYALAESSERSHRKLMRILKEYDEVLELSISGLLERELCVGVRPDAASHDQACSVIPGVGALFPLEKSGEPTPIADAPKLGKLSPTRGWTDPVSIGSTADSYTTRIGHYARKISSFLPAGSGDQQSWARLGSSEASELCEAVFQRIESLRSEKITRPMKERALVDLFRELKEQGYASTKWSIPKELHRMADIFQVPDPTKIGPGAQCLEFSTLKSSEKYYQRALAELNRLRSEVGMLGSKYMTQRQMDMMMGFGGHGLLMLAQQRSAISGLLSERVSLLELVAESSFVDRILPISQNYLRERVYVFERDFASALESLSQLSLLLKSSQHLLDAEVKAEWTREMVTKIDSYLSTSACRPPARPFIATRQRIQTVTDKRKTLEGAATMLRNGQESCANLGCLPIVAFETCGSKLDDAMASASLCMDPLPSAQEADGSHESKLSSFSACCSLSVQSSLLAVQAIRKDREDEKTDETDATDLSSSIWDSHRAAATEWASIDLKRMNSRFREVLAQLVSIHESDSVNAEARSCCTGVASDLGVLISNTIAVVDARLRDYISFYRNTAKLHYILLRIFRVLVSKGFCSDKETEDDDDGAEGDASGMTFEDGTGMGEGEGSKDVTDQIENEEQLLGLKSDLENEEKADQGESKQLDEEEAEKGMEMEGEFDGEMYDMPDKQPEEPKNGEDDEEEELDREMGDEGGPNEEVIDEKMWDESDDEEDAEKGEEKFEKNSSVEGATAAEDEMMTKEDGDDEQDEGKNDAQQNDPNQEEPKEEEPKEEDGENADKLDEMINEDAEDNYEDSHGVNVRDDQVNDEEEENQMELDENLELDETPEKEGDEGDSADDEEEGAGTGDIVPDPEDPLAENEEEDAQPEDEMKDPDEDEDEPGIGEARMDPDTVGEEPPDGDQLEDTDPEPLKKPDTSESQKGLGVRARDGKDAVEDAAEEEEEGEGGAEEETEDGNGAGASEMEPSGQGGSSSGNQDGQDLADGEAGTQRNNSQEIPNPLTSPGDATKFWHRKLNIVNSQSELDDEADKTGEQSGENDDGQKNGDFEFAGNEEHNTTQTLAGVDENDATQLQQEQPEEKANETSKDTNADETKAQETSEQPTKRRVSKPNPLTTDDPEDDKSINDMDVESEDGQAEENGHAEDDPESEHSDADGEDLSPSGNLVVSDLSQLHVDDESMDLDIMPHRITEEEQAIGISSAEASEARARWSQILGETHGLSRRLCEKLRLVMEPLVASKLRGDYRTGKRINMKRVIGYIASGYRKDKIWLRRTKPAKRNYRILVAVDDSESMVKSGAGEMALKAMATLAVGMSQLEIGEIGVASFGNEMNLLHPFNLPFTSESGANVVRNFKFDQQRTRTALCVESALMALDMPGDQASMQLVFMISDGRIERDSRSALRRLIREMAERNILLAMIIVEGGDSKKNSIINMKEVTFENGKPNVKLFIEDYPFPYYIVLDDMRTLPEVLGDALRQWFEMLTRLQGSTT